jgi:hypothetical protein
VKPCVFIHTNARQKLGALVARYALHRNSRRSDSFDVRILDTADYPFLAAREGQPFKRDGYKRIWRNDDLQSFTPLRFLPPEEMRYQGRALVIDPDVFAVADVWELLSRDMQGRSVLCRRRAGLKGHHGEYATSVMLLDCACLTHWNCQEQFDELFAFTRDYMDWISLKLEAVDSVGPLEREWNDFDRLTAETRMLHNTRRLTQPWKTGLPIEFTPEDGFRSSPLYDLAVRVSKKVIGPNKLISRYWRHPDRNQERLFFGLLRECLDKGLISEALIREEMARDHIRHDALALLERTAPLAA